MIRKQEILDRAAEWQLRPEVVEKDYVLGWLLAGLGQLPIRAHWIFKGGTAIKKCYFETYRFSEDLDFSLLPDAAYGEGDIRANIVALTERVSELSGLEFPRDALVLRIRRNLQGQPTFEVRVGYKGPLAFPGTPKVLFDITQHEPVLVPPSNRAIAHSYPDPLPDGVTVRAYSFDELLAEKTRALYERRRPRDLYDVIHLIENLPGALDLPEMRALFVQKCEYKTFPPPTATEVVNSVSEDPELRSEWSNMLAHQLPALPDLDGMLAKLGSVLSWLNPVPLLELTEPLEAAPIPAGSTPLGAPGLRYWGGGLPLEKIRFAASNRLLLEFDYHSKHRVVEPYSLRQAASTGNILLYAWESSSRQIKAFKVTEMQNVRATSTLFTPRFAVEISEGGHIEVSRPARRGELTFQRVRQSRGTSHLGPKYVFECPYCQKQFVHRTNDPSLGKHRRPDGWSDCPSRRGHLLKVR